MSTDLAAARERAGALEQQLSFVQGELSRSLRDTSAAEARAQAAIDEGERQAKKHAETASVHQKHPPDRTASAIAPSPLRSEGGLGNALARSVVFDNNGHVAFMKALPLDDERLFA